MALSSDMLSLAGLSEKDLTVLQKLSQVGAATLTDLAVRLRFQPEDVEPHLQTLCARGLVDVANRESGREREIYRITQTVRSLLKL